MEMEVPSVAAHAPAPATTTPPSHSSGLAKPSLLKPPPTKRSPVPRTADASPQTGSSSPYLLSSSTSFDSGSEADEAPVMLKKNGAARGKNGSNTEASAGTGGANKGGGGRRDPGRWTTEEHVLFLKGLEIYGKSWKKISDIVKTRTVVQIRTHAQKYLIKLEKAKKAASALNHAPPQHAPLPPKKLPTEAPTNAPPPPPAFYPVSAPAPSNLPPAPTKATTATASMATPAMPAPVSNNGAAPPSAAPANFNNPSLGGGRGPLPLPMAAYAAGMPWLPNHPFLHHPNGAPLFSNLQQGQQQQQGMGVDMGTSTTNACSSTAAQQQAAAAQQQQQSFLDFTRHLAATMPHLFMQPPGGMQWPLGAFPAMQQLYQLAAHHNSMMGAGPPPPPLPTPPFPNMATARAAMMNPNGHCLPGGRPPRVTVPPMPIFTPQPAPPAPATAAPSSSSSAPAPSSSNKRVAPGSCSPFDVARVNSSSSGKAVMSPPSRPVARVGLDYWADMMPPTPRDEEEERPGKRRRHSSDAATSCSPLDDLQLVLGEEGGSMMMDPLEEALEWERFGSQLLTSEGGNGGGVDRGCGGSDPLPPTAGSSRVVCVDAELMALDDEIMQWFDGIEEEGGHGGGEEEDDDDLLAGIELADDDVALCDTPELGGFAVAA